MNITTEMTGIYLFNPIEETSDWIVKMDPLNLTIEWKDDIVVKEMDKSLKRKIEKEILNKHKDYKWLKEFKACIKITGKNSPRKKYHPDSIWATGKKEAGDIFKSMSINFITIQQSR